MTSVADKQGSTNSARVLGKTLLVLGAGLAVLAGTGSRTLPPTKADDICAVFAERPGWYRDALRAESEWGVPVPVQMAIIRQESGFRPGARPAREWRWGLLPGDRPSTAYGYGQILDGTWAWYRDRTGNDHASRRRFGDVTDFIGWYAAFGHRHYGIPLDDAYHQYLAYHEGHAGFTQGRHEAKPWLKDVARRVAEDAARYGAQLDECPVRQAHRG